VDVSLSEFKDNQGNQTGCIDMKGGYFSISNSYFTKQYS